MTSIGVDHKNRPIPPQKWEKYKRIQNHKKRLEIIALFMTSLLQKNYEDAMMLCMIGLKSEPKNQILQDYYHLLSEKLEDPSSSDISSDEEDDETGKINKEEEDIKNKRHAPEKQSDREKAGTHSKLDNNEDVDADSSATSEDEDSSETSSDSSESDDFELEVHGCSSSKINQLRSKVVPSRPPPKLDPKWLRH